MATLKGRITVDPEQCKGRPCIRDTQIRVSDVLDLLAQDLSHEQILAEHPDLEREDIRACLRFASDRLNHRIIPRYRKWVVPGALIGIIVFWIASCTFFFSDKFIPKTMSSDNQTSAVKGQFGDSLSSDNQTSAVKGQFGDSLSSNNQTSAVKGQFGDSFGAVNALFSGLAFVGVIWAIMKTTRGA